MKKKIFRAGTIPYYLENNEIFMLFMVPSDPKYGGDRPQIAKGKQEDSEPLSETAMREAEEELGLKRNNVINFFNVGLFLGRTEFYVAKIIDKNNFNKHTEETKKTIWMSLNEFENKGRKLHFPIVKKAYDLIMEKEEKLDELT